MATPSGADPFRSTATPQASPRKLTTHQKAVLIQVLRVFPEQKMCVCYRPDAGDAQAYARDFLAVFKAVGWEADEIELAAGAREPAGLAIGVSREDAIPHASLALRDALLIYHIEAKIFCDPARNIEAGTFALIVGAPA